VLNHPWPATSVTSRAAAGLQTPAGAVPWSWGCGYVRPYGLTRAARSTAQQDCTGRCLCSPEFFPQATAGALYKQRLAQRTMDKSKPRIGIAHIAATAIAVDGREAVPSTRRDRISTPHPRSTPIGAEAAASARVSGERGPSKKKILPGRPTPLLCRRLHPRATG
jgi:hypothetical protein